jgi:hypothetical protein
MVNYPGVCRGGPDDGLHVTGHCKSYRVTRQTGPPMSMIVNGKKVYSEPTYRVGFYDYVLGQWIWRAWDGKRTI